LFDQDDQIFAAAHPADEVMVWRVEENARRRVDLTPGGGRPWAEWPKFLLGKMCALSALSALARGFWRKKCAP
jgi:hypothetical protein